MSGILYTLKMQQKFNMPLTHQQEPSFSFQQPPSSHFLQRSLSKCLRLKTNESIDGRVSIDIKNDNRKSYYGRQSTVGVDHCRRLVQEEYDQRTESLIKQYELRLNKQEEYYGLRQWKLKQEIENLQRQNEMQNDQLRRFKGAPRQNNSKCTLCGDGQVLSHYNKLISQNQQHHSNCLTEKKQLTVKVDQITSKYGALEEQHQKVSQELRTLNRQMRGYHGKVRQLELEKNQAMESLGMVEQMWRDKVLKLESQSRQLHRQLQSKQAQSKQYQREIQMNQSKATVQSTQSVLTNQQSSLKTSQLQQQRQNFYKPRSSVPKMMGYSDDKQNQTRGCLRDLNSQFNINRNGSKPKHDPLRWKYF